jgi:hypothetical protein
MMMMNVKNYYSNFLFLLMLCNVPRYKMKVWMDGEEEEDFFFFDIVFIRNIFIGN